MTAVLSSIGHALWMAFLMFWEILWALNLGFLLSAIVQAVVSKREMVRLLPDDSPKTLAKACGLGAASSSCSYAAVALARSIFHKGANFTAAMVFELASTNLVAELAIVMVILLGWQFAVAEFVGAPVMVVILVVLFRLFLKPAMVDRARAQAERGLHGKMEGHAEMDMAVTEGPILERIMSDRGKSAISHYFVMDWLAVWKLKSSSSRGTESLSTTGNGQGTQFMRKSSTWRQLTRFCHDCVGRFAIVANALSD